MAFIHEAAEGVGRRGVGLHWWQTDASRIGHAGCRLLTQWHRTAPGPTHAAGGATHSGYTHRAGSVCQPEFRAARGCSVKAQQCGCSTGP
eukprot:68268-Prymnesium_polylepis.1